MAELDELHKDAEEARALLSSATRTRWKELLSAELVNIEKKISGIRAIESEHSGKGSSSSNKLYTTTIRNYSWDQSDKFMKIYVTLPGVHNIAKENISCDFGKCCVDFKVLDLDDKNYELKIAHLAYSVNPEKSFHKVKSDMVVIFASKLSNKAWEAVTAEEKRTLDAKKTNKKSPSKPDDPTTGLMDLMKQMYDDGDDDMKRMLNKTWYETQKKSNTGTELPDIADMKMSN